MAAIPYRYLTLWHEERVLNDTMPDLKPGEAAFRSYYLPSLEGGLHSITVEQTVSMPKDSSTKYAPIKAAPVTQKFTVVAPHYKVPEESIDSVFPPTGHSALLKTLPHMVLKDPHFPWARYPSTSDKQKEDESNRIPWVALITFTADELQASDPEIFAQLPGAKINENFGIDTPVGIAHEKLTAGTSKTSSLLAKPDSRELEQPASLISIKKPLFEKLFSKGGKCDITQYRYLSHIRKVATEGMMSAMYGTSGQYSIIVGHRVGPFHTEKPTPLIAHLVSLERIEKANLSDLKENILLTSLHSWTYTSLPLGSFDVRSALQNLGDTLTVLRTNLNSQPEKKPEEKGLSIEDIITKRQDDGYTLIRHRTVTGEETAAIYRGPLTPTFVSHKTGTEMTIQSNFGTDLQILDPNLSLMDISYAAAWQLGRTLAMGDQAFTAALSRVRRHMHMESLKSSQIKVHKKLGDYISRADIVDSIPDLVHGLENLNSKLHINNTTVVSTNRWQRKPVERVDISLQSPHIFSQIYENAVPVAMEMSQAADGGKYNYHNVPKNTDYALIQGWVHDKLNLASIPAHYLIPDKSYLPEETLRFFYMDENWTDALTDGALSLANQWTNKPEEDYCRMALKEAIGDYIRQPVPGLGYATQMPKYGFLLRTKVLVQFPDLTVSATFDRAKIFEDEKPKPPILIQRMLSHDIMLCLFDCCPPELQSLKFTLPAQQQMYTAAAKFNSNELFLDIKKMYTVDRDKAQDQLRGRALDTDVKYPRSESKIFDWDSRTIKVEDYAKEIHKKLCAPKTEKGMGSDFTEPRATSAMLALQLNEPIYTLDIGKIVAENAVTIPDEPFQFLVPEFPAHKYRPPPLPKPLEEKRLYPQKLYRPSPVSLPTSIPRLISSTSDPIKILDAPRFDFQVYTLDGTRAKNFIPTNRELPPDIIFSIRTNDYARETFNYTVLKLTIEIRRADKPPGKRVPLPILTPDYEPIPPSMLSNLRFNIFTSFSDGFMMIDLIPRSSKGIPLKLVKEASFMLSMVGIRPQEQTSHISLFPTYVENKDQKGNRDKWRETWANGVDVVMGPEKPELNTDAEEWDFME